MSTVAFLVMALTVFGLDDDPSRTAEKKLQEAFGPNSPIVRDAKLKFEVALGKDVLVFACKEMKVEANGKVKLTPGHYACFVMDKGRFRAGSTGESPWAELTFDRAVTTIAEMQKARLKHVHWPQVLARGLEQ
jgi:hypothetical protein